MNIPQIDHWTSTTADQDGQGSSTSGWPATGPTSVEADSDLYLDYPSDHVELNLTAADIEAIGSGYHTPIPDSASENLQHQHQLQQHQSQSNDGNEHDEHETMDHGYGPGDDGGGVIGDDGEFLPVQDDPEPAEDGPVHGTRTGSRRGQHHDLKGLSSEEKKLRQKENNKRAAERSRAKRKKDMNSTESQVTQLRRENEQLRARLNALRSFAPPTSEPYTTIPGPTLVEIPTLDPALRQSATPPEVDNQDIGIDRLYNHKLAVELANAKSLLLEKNFELERIRGREVEENVETSRRELVHKHAGIHVLRSEESAMASVLRLLADETTELGARRRAIDVEVARRGGVVAGGSQEHGTLAGMEETGEEERIRTREEEAASHTQVLAQAVRDVAMGEARGMREGEGGGQVFDMQPYIEEALGDWPEHHGGDL